MSFNEDLVVEEYKSLRGEIDALSAEARLIGRLSLTGAAAIYAWLAANAQAGVANFGLYIPLFIAVFGFMHSLSSLSRIMLIADYVRSTIDPLTTVQGWETYLANKRTESPFRQQLIGWSYTIFWVVFMAGTGLAAILLTA